MIKYKCHWCGREMVSKVAHNCNTGFRKRHLLWESINMTNLENFVGNELSVLATADLETPSKKILLNISQIAGRKWAEENKVDFQFVNKAITAAMKYALSFYHEEEITTRNPSLEQTRIFGFIAGVIDKINENN